MHLGNNIAVVGSRQFRNYRQLCDYLDSIIYRGDSIVSGGAIGVDSMAQRYAKERGLRITILYPDFGRYGRGATFVRNQEIVEESDQVIAFYASGHFQEGGTRNVIDWCLKMGVKYDEIREDERPT